MTDKVKLRIVVDNIYPDGKVTMTQNVTVNRPPDGVEMDSEGWDDWAYDEIFPHTGTGQTEGDAGYFVEVLSTSDAEAIPVGTKFEWGT